MGEGGPPCGRPKNMPLLWSLMAFLSHRFNKHGAPTELAPATAPHTSQMGSVDMFGHGDLCNPGPGGVS